MPQCMLLLGSLHMPAHTTHQAGLRLLAFVMLPCQVRCLKRERRGGLRGHQQLSALNASRCTLAPRNQAIGTLRAASIDSMVRLQLRERSWR